MLLCNSQCQPCNSRAYSAIPVPTVQTWHGRHGNATAFYLCPTTASVDAAILAITADSIFKIGSYAYTAVATSIFACGLGIACDVWFLLRYNWIDLESFIVRALPTQTSSSTDISIHSIVLATYMVHTSPSPCHHACPLSAC